ncbi:MAG: hypothetical protein K8S97_09150 [Anaerolineae bacterium]|nr:hypothetical protein [Anaerolineae bacterium]
MRDNVLVRLNPGVQAQALAEPYSDVLSRDAALQDLAPGDRVPVLAAGACGMAMASNYNARTRPPEVLVERDLWRVIRRRETWDDLLRLEEPQ